MDPTFTEFSKAYIRHEHGQNPAISQRRIFTALRAIEHVLTHERGEANPAGVDLGTFDNAAQVIREHCGKSAAYGGCLELKHLAKFFARNGLAHNDVGHWVSPISKNHLIHRQIGAEADAHRRSKLPNLIAVNAIGTIFANGFDLKDNDSHPDIYVTSIIAMLMGQPARIGEIHEMAIDLEIEQRDLQGDLQYGFRYRSFKSTQGTRIKWIPAIWVPIAREAVSRIREITEGPRSFANYIEAQIDRKRIDPTAPLRFYRHEGCPNVADDEPLTGKQAAAALGFTRKLYRSFLASRGLTSRDGAYTLRTLWLFVLERLPSGFPYVKGAKNKRL